MAANAAPAEQLVMTTQRFFKGHAGPADKLENLYRATGEIAARGGSITGRQLSSAQLRCLLR